MNKVILYVIVAIHVILIVVNALSMLALCILPIYLYVIYPSVLSLVMGVAVAVPLISFLVRLGTIWNHCPLTALENKYRESLGMPRVRGFIGHYFLKPLREWRRRLCSNT